MKTLYLDCFCGISGDMTVGALLDAGAEFSLLEDAVASMGLEGVRIEAEKVSKKGIQATRFHVHVDPNVRQPHRHLRHILEIIDRTSMPDSAKAGAKAVFERLGTAEAEVHGVPVEKIHFHEVGAVDSIVDIVAANLALHSLGIGRIISSPLVTGAGTVACDHGVMPVPAPATAILLKGVPWTTGGLQGEMTTPTGAALVRQWASSFASEELLDIQSVGYGAGSRELPDRANVLRIFIGKSKETLPDTESICVMETMIDNMNPELVAVLIPALLDAGAKDAYLTPVVAKKGRLGQQLTALCDDSGVADVLKAILDNSQTLGVRFRRERRWVLERQHAQVETPWGIVRVKVGALKGERHSVAPEFQDCLDLARKHSVPVRSVYETALTKVLAGDKCHD